MMSRCASLVMSRNLRPGMSNLGGYGQSSNRINPISVSLRMARCKALLCLLTAWGPIQLSESRWPLMGNMRPIDRGLGVVCSALHKKVSASAFFCRTLSDASRSCRIASRRRSCQS